MCVMIGASYPFDIIRSRCVKRVNNAAVEREHILHKIIEERSIFRDKAEKLINLTLHLVFINDLKPVGGKVKSKWHIMVRGLLSLINNG